MRPTQLHVGGVLRWVINTRNPDTMLLKDADATPTITVRKNGSATSDTVTIVKRAATTGIYDCEYNPAGEVEGDIFNIRESAQVTGTTTAQASYEFSWPFTVVAMMRGTDGANTTTPPTADAVADEVQTRTIARVTLVDTTTINTDMRGTNGALTSLGTNAPAGWLNTAAFADGALTAAKFANGAFAAVWSITERTLSAFGFNVTVQTNNDKTGYRLTSDYDAAKTAAQPSDVSPTINFAPTINPTPVTVNPTVLSPQSVTDIQTGLATTQNVTNATNTITTAIDNIELELTPENIEEISDAVSEAVGEGLVEQIEREGGILSTILGKFLGIDLLAKWLRK